MPQPTALQTLIELEREALDRKTRALGQARKEKHQLDVQVTTLHAYRREYLERMNASLATGVPADLLLNHHAFVASLDRAIDKAGRFALLQSAKVDVQNDAWRAQYRRKNAFETLIERRQAQERLMDARAEQRHTDELSAQLRSRTMRPLKPSAGR